MYRKDYMQSYYLEHKKEIQEYKHKYYLKNKDRYLTRQNLQVEDKKAKSIRMKIYHQKLQVVLNNLKINGCAICGYGKCSHALDFHHVNPKDKKFNLNVLAISKNINILVEELNKCILLCKNCHYEIEFCIKEA